MGIYNVPKKEQVVQEVYFGKTKGMQELQAQFSKFRSKFINNTFQFSTKINIDTDLLKFNRMVEKEFGFKTFSLYVINDIYHEAYTLPVGLTGPDSMTSSKQGFKFKADKGFTTLVCISTGLLLDKEFTDEEIVAILLHEIGHNFSGAIDKHSSVFFTMLTIINIIHFIEQIILILTVPIVLAEKITASFLSLPVFQRLFISFGNALRKKNKNATKVLDFLIGCISGISAITTESKIANSLFTMVFSDISKVEIWSTIIYNQIRKLTPMSLLCAIMGYNGERVSDSFATAYGYGPELGSGLQKMEFSAGGSIVRKGAEAVPIVNNMYKLMVLPVEILTTGFDCHPNTPARVNQQLVYLEKELQKQDLDPAVKEDMLSDISKLQKGLEDNMFSPAQNKILGSMKDPYFISRVYCATMYKIAGGDVRDLIYTIDNHQQFDDAYEKYKK